MREDDDWILNSLSTDLTLSREKVCYDLWRQLNEMEEMPVPSASIEYAELFMNRSYQGVYGLMTPIDAKLMDMKPGDLLYRLKTWKEEMTAPGKLTDYNGERRIYNENGFPYVEIEYPGSLGGEYIWDPLEAYQDFVFETGDLGELKERGVALDTENFILYELFCEMTRASDNSWKNLFVAARKGEDGMYTLRSSSNGISKNAIPYLIRRAAVSTISALTEDMDTRPLYQWIRMFFRAAGKNGICGEKTASDRNT